MKRDLREGHLIYACLLGLVVAAASIGPVSAGPNPNAPGNGPQILAPITPGGGWQAFSVSGLGDVAGPFSYESQVTTSVYVTDVACKGDEFEVFDGIVPHGVTSSVANEFPDCTGVTDPEVAFSDPTYSSGCFELPPGEHNIFVELIEAWDAGAGAFIQVIEGHCGNLYKDIIAGPDLDSDTVPDLVVPKKPLSALGYQFAITYLDHDGGPDNVLVADTLPAEWIAWRLDGTAVGGSGIDTCGERVNNVEVVPGLVDIYKNGKVGKKCQSSTSLEWTFPASGASTLTVDAKTRQSPGKGHDPVVYAPTSCGALYLNNGAVAFDAEPPYDEVAGPSNPLCLAVVDQELLEVLPEYDYNADHDEDSTSSWEEACVLGTDPCNPDTDGDGVLDGEEVASGCMDPLVADTDGDGISDGDEVDAGTDPCDDDTDGDGVLDGADACPLEGPPGLGQTLQGDGCLSCGEAFICGVNLPLCTGGSCLCVATIEGANVCHTGQTCPSNPCTSSNECGPDEACLVDTCCGEPVCLNSNVCNDPLAPAAADAGGPNSVRR